MEYLANWTKIRVKRSQCPNYMQKYTEIRLAKRSTYKLSPYNGQQNNEPGREGNRLLKSRTNNRTLTSSKFHQGSCTTEFLFSMTHIHVCEFFLWLVDLAGQHYADISRSNTHLKACGTLEWMELSSGLLQKGTVWMSVFARLSTICSPVQK